jgi:hypothetical protein
MSARRPVRQLVVAVLLGVLVGGGLMAVTPAGAEVSQAVATNWKKIWKKNLKPLADKRYYTKSKSDAKYQAKGSYETAGSGYSKAESDAKYQSKTQVIRGTFFAGGNSAAGSTLISGGGISFGVTFSAAPTVHYIKVGDPIPADCPGTAAAPDASPGHLCVFESNVSNMSLNRGTLNLDAGNGATPYGAGVYGFTAAAGQGHMLGSWAARPLATTQNGRIRPTRAGNASGGLH